MSVARTRVKICGITSIVDGLAAIHAGADAIGLVFYPPSPRYLVPARAAELVNQLPPFVSVVGLFVNAPQVEILEIATICRLDGIQLHGDEPPKACLGLPGRVIKAVRVARREDLVGLDDYPVSGLLLDAKIGSAYGGTGHRFDWSLLRGFQSRHPVILAGGLHDGNVANAIREVRPFAVDVSSGVEITPGSKNPEKMLRFTRQVREIDRSLYHARHRMGLFNDFATENTEEWEKKPSK